MTNEIPSIWLWVSGIFFLFGITAFGASIMVMLKLLRLAEEMKPKIESLTAKVEALTVKVDHVADEVKETVVAVRQGVNGFQGKAQNILGTVETVAGGFSKRMDGITPILTVGITLFKIFSQWKAKRAPASQKQVSPKPALKSRRG